MDRLTLAYCAGIIDAHGSIGIKRSDYSIRVAKQSHHPVYSERITLRQADPEAVDLLHELFPGYRYMHKPKSTSRALHSWQVTNLRAARCLRLIVPYMRIKRERALNCLALRELKEQSKTIRVAKGREHMGSAPRPEWIGDRMQQCYCRALRLNRRRVPERAALSEG